MKKLIIGLTLLTSMSAFSANKVQTRKQLTKISQCASAVTQEIIKVSVCDKLIKSSLIMGISRSDIKKAIVKGKEMGASIISAEDTTFAQLEREITAERHQQIQIQQIQQIPQAQ
jgi:dihydroxyacid dehydratase/phosphogluconate dehydratase